MPLDDLVQVIETLQQRIRDHGDSLRQNEIRTRVALIDPLLKALGWDVADPELVTPEYRVDAGWADYALLGLGNRPATIVEAKRLGSFVENHLDQMVGYCIAQGIAYAAVTDGNHWQLYRTFDPVPLEQKRVLDVQISNTQPHECALQFLLLWRPNVSTGKAIQAEKPIPLDGQEAKLDSGNGPAVLPPTSEDWVSLADVQNVRGNPPPAAIRFARGEERQIKYWWQVLFETAEWLASTDKLTSSQCPVQLGNQKKKYVVNVQSRHPDGKDFYSSHELINGLFCETSVSARSAVRQSKNLLEHCGQNAASVLLRVG